MRTSRTTEIERLLGQSFCRRYKVDVSREYEIEWIRARQLLVANRIDLIAKYKLVEALDKGWDCPFFEELYAKHIEAFTRGSFTEVGQEDTKNSLDKYLMAFRELMEDIKLHGISPDKSLVPVGKRNAIMDGAHRVSIAAYYDLEVPVVRLDWLEPHNDAAFFKERMLEDDYLDYLVSEYCKLKEQVYVACMWPKANTKPLQERAEQMMREACTIVYKRKLEFDFASLRNFMIQVYSSFNWLGGLRDHFSGASGYAELVYDKSEMITVYVLEGAPLEEILALKKSIRELYDLGNTSIHISDTPVEARSMMDMLFNSNSRHCLRYAQPDKFIPFNEKIAYFKQILAELNIGEDEVALDSGSIMALYGLRDAIDIDYISVWEGDPLRNRDKLFQSHADVLVYYRKTADQLVYDPRNYLWYYGVKFICVRAFLEMKKHRDACLRKENKRNPKDAEDILLLEQIGEGNMKRSHIKELYLNTRRKARNIRYQLQNKVLYDEKWSFIRKLYHLIRRGRWY